MTVAQAAEYLNAHPDSVRRWIRDGKIPAARVGALGNYILYEDELAEVLTTGLPTRE